MSRFGWRRVSPRSGWRSTAPEGRLLRTLPGVRPATPVLAPDRDSRLSDGVVIETTLRARVLGAPLLRINGTVSVSPARLVVPPSPQVVRGKVAPGGREAVAPDSRNAVGTTPGAALAEAARLLRESRQRLEA